MTRAQLPVVDRARRRHRALAVVMATMLVPLVVGSAAAKTTPVVNVTPMVTNANVSVQVDVDQSTNQVASCTYVLDANAAVSCGAIAPVGKQASRYTISLTSQATGGHTITVTVVLNGKGTGSGSATFTIAPPRVFAIAFTDTNGDHTYQDGVDHLIAALVDTNRDGVVDAGDTAVTDEFPLSTDPVSAFGTFGVTSATVTSAVITPEEVDVNTTATIYMWFSKDQLVSLLLCPNHQGFCAEVLDNANPNFANPDQILINDDNATGLSPTPVPIAVTQDDRTDDEFLDVTFDLP
jgi:hypothetical protein